MRTFSRLGCWLALLAAVPGLVSTSDPQVLDDQPTTLVYPPFWHTPLGIHRGTPEILSLFVGTRTVFSSPEGLACARLLEAEPGPADPNDCRVTVMGANTGAGHLLFNPSMLRLEVAGDRGPTLGLFRRPTGVALSASGWAMVADAEAGRVKRLRWDHGNLLPAGDLTPPAGGWLAPWGVALDSADNIYVSDARGGRLAVYSADGRLMRVIGPAVIPGLSLQAPRAVAVTDDQEPWSYYRENYLYVIDHDGRRLVRLAPAPTADTSAAVTTADAVPAGDTPAGFAWVALDFYDNVWVTDPGRCQVHKFDRNLNYLASFGGPGQGDRHFQRPTGIAIHRQFGQVFVADAAGAQYFWIGADVRDVRLSWRAGPEGLLEIAFILTEPASLRIEALPERGSPRMVLAAAWMDSGPHTVAWPMPADLRTQTVRFTLTVEATYSSAPYFAKRLAVTWPATTLSK